MQLGCSNMSCMLIFSHHPLTLQRAAENTPHLTKHSKRIIFSKKHVTFSIITRVRSLGFIPVYTDERIVPGNMDCMLMISCYQWKCGCWSYIHSTIHEYHFKSTANGWRFSSNAEAAVFYCVKKTLLISCTEIMLFWLWFLDTTCFWWCT